MGSVEVSPWIALAYSGVIPNLDVASRSLGVAYYGRLLSPIVRKGNGYVEE